VRGAITFPQAVPQARGGRSPGNCSIGRLVPLRFACHSTISVLLPLAELACAARIARDTIELFLHKLLFPPCSDYCMHCLHLGLSSPPTPFVAQIPAYFCVHYGLSLPPNPSFARIPACLFSATLSLGNPIARQPYCIRDCHHHPAPSLLEYPPAFACTLNFHYHPAPPLLGYPPAFARKPYRSETLSLGNPIARQPYCLETLLLENTIARKPRYCSETLLLGNPSALPRVVIARIVPTLRWLPSIVPVRDGSISHAVIDRIVSARDGSLPRAVTAKIWPPAPAWQARPWAHRPSSSAPCVVPTGPSRIGQHIKNEPCAKQRALLGVFFNRFSSVSRDIPTRARNVLSMHFV
jgi:hypothetical protein